MGVCWAATAAAAATGFDATQDCNDARSRVHYLKTTVRTAGLPVGLTVASCMYFAYGKLLFSARDFCSSAFQGAVAALL